MLAMASRAETDWIPTKEEDIQQNLHDFQSSSSSSSPDNIYSEKMNVTCPQNNEFIKPQRNRDGDDDDDDDETDIDTADNGYAADPECSQKYDNIHQDFFITPQRDAEVSVDESSEHSSSSSPSRKKHPQHARRRCTNMDNWSSHSHSSGGNSNHRRRGRREHGSTEGLQYPKTTSVSSQQQQLPLESTLRLRERKNRPSSVEKQKSTAIEPTSWIRRGRRSSLGDFGEMHEVRHTSIRGTRRVGETNLEDKSDHSTNKGNGSDLPPHAPRRASRRRSMGAEFETTHTTYFSSSSHHHSRSGNRRRRRASNNSVEGDFAKFGAFPATSDHTLGSAYTFSSSGDDGFGGEILWVPPAENDTKPDTITIDQEESYPTTVLRVVDSSTTSTMPTTLLPLEERQAGIDSWMELAIRSRSKTLRQRRASIGAVNGEFAEATKIKGGSDHSAHKGNVSDLPPHAPRRASRRRSMGTEFETNHTPSLSSSYHRSRSKTQSQRRASIGAVDREFVEATKLEDKSDHSTIKGNVSVLPPPAPRRASRRRSMGAEFETTHTPSLSSSNHRSRSGNRRRRRASNNSVEGDFAKFGAFPATSDHTLGSAYTCSSSGDDGFGGEILWVPPAENDTKPDTITIDQEESYPTTVLRVVDSSTTSTMPTTDSGNTFPLLTEEEYRQLNTPKTSGSKSHKAKRAVQRKAKSVTKTAGHIAAAPFKLAGDVITDNDEANFADPTIGIRLRTYLKDLPSDEEFKSISEETGSSASKTGSSASKKTSSTLGHHFSGHSTSLRSRDSKISTDSSNIVSSNMSAGTMSTFKSDEEFKSISEETGSSASKTGSSASKKTSSTLGHHFSGHSTSLRSRDSKISTDSSNIVSSNMSAGTMSTFKSVDTKTSMPSLSSINSRDDSMNNEDSQTFCSDSLPPPPPRVATTGAAVIVQDGFLATTLDELSPAAILLNSKRPNKEQVRWETRSGLPPKPPQKKLSVTDFKTDTKNDGDAVPSQPKRRAGFPKKETGEMRDTQPVYINRLLSPIPTVRKELPPFLIEEREEWEKQT